MHQNRKREWDKLLRERDELRAQLAVLSDESDSLKRPATRLTDDDRRLATETREHLDKLRTAHADLVAAGPGKIATKSLDLQFGSRLRPATG